MLFQRIAKKPRPLKSAVRRREKMRIYLVITFTSAVFLLIAGMSLMGANQQQNSFRIVEVLLFVTHDPGHGGVRIGYGVTETTGGYRVTLTKIRRFPQPGERDFSPSRSEKILKKKRARVRKFLDELLKVHNIDELEDLAFKGPLLHPTFYELNARTSTGRKIEFRYIIEAAKHLDSRYERLVSSFEAFFR
jgi:hypothetical protein